MIRLAAFILFVVGVAVLVIVPSGLGSTLAQSPGVGDYPYCVQFDSDTAYHAIPCPSEPTPTSTPWPTWTPIPTNTPIMPSVTPDSSATPPPTNTAIPTDTPEPTPTPENAVTCDLVAKFNINKRTGPGTTYDRDGVWMGGVQSTLDEFIRDDPFLWAHHSSGNWSAVAEIHGEVIWWVWTPETGVFCQGVEGWPEGWLNPPANRAAFIVGLHVTNANRAELTTFQLAMNAAGYQSGVKPYVGEQYCLDALGNGNTCTERWPPDCPEGIGNNDPRGSALKYMEARNGAVQTLWAMSGYSDLLVIELTNECENEPYEWWNEWFLAAISYAEGHNWPQLALGGLGPGYGNYVMFEAWQPALMANHARGGYLSTHNYAPVEYCGGDGSLSNGDIYCAFRHRLNYRLITEELGYDVRILITESSPTDGYQPITNATLIDIGRYTCMIQDDLGLYGIYYWNVGTWAPFMDANLGPHLVKLAASIAACGEG